MSIDCCTYRCEQGRNCPVRAERIPKEPMTKQDFWSLAGIVSLCIVHSALAIIGLVVVIAELMRVVR